WNGAAWVGADPGYVLTISPATAIPGSVNSPVLSTTWSVTNEPSTAAAWGTGTFTLFMHGTDSAGNTSTDVNDVFIVDSIAPTITITNPTQNAYFNAATVVSSISTAAGSNLMKGSATDDLSGVASMGAKLIRLSGGATTYWNG